jgi:hypothetical protein
MVTIIIITERITIIKGTIMDKIMDIKVTIINMVTIMTITERITIIKDMITDKITDMIIIEMDMIGDIMKRRFMEEWKQDLN